MWIICVACHHTAQVKKSIRCVRCSVCGSRVARTVLSLKQYMLNGGQTPAKDAKVRMFAQLISIAKERGYKMNWAVMKYQIIFGTSPIGHAPKPMNPSGELLWWIKKQNSEYAKQRRVQEMEVGKKSMSILMTEKDWNTDF